MSDETNDFRWMREALAEARKGLGHTSPNPAVGAVLVSNGAIIARGFHSCAGRAHAEVECLQALGGRVSPKATLYVTLEPCSTQGQSGPCTQAIIRAGVKSVVIGATDPNPRHAGRGLVLLKAAGVKVRTDVLAPECSALNEAFNKWIQTGVPFVIAKCGMSLDGRLTRPPNESQWLTSATARRHAQQLRAQVDAILIGANTLRRDNPRLTARGIAGAKQPWRVVLTRSGKLPRSAQLFTDRFAERTLVVRGKKLATVLRELGEKKITSVLIEGGGQILSEALEQRLIDKLAIYLAPIFTGGPIIAFGGDGAASTAESLALERSTYDRIGNDLLLTGYPVEKKRILMK